MVINVSKNWYKAAKRAQGKIILEILDMHVYAYLSIRIEIKDEISLHKALLSIS